MKRHRLHQAPRVGSICSDHTAAHVSKCRENRRLVPLPGRTPLGPEAFWPKPPTLNRIQPLVPTSLSRTRRVGTGNTLTAPPRWQPARDKQRISATTKSQVPKIKEAEAEETTHFTKLQSPDNPLQHKHLIRVTQLQTKL